MAISKTENEIYRLRLYYPQDIQEMIGENKLYYKTFKTRKEAKEAKIDFYAKIKELRENKEKNVFELGGEALFKDFFEYIWIDAYTAGLTSRNTKALTPVTITNTKDIFRLHILPMFGKYTLNYLNQNKAFVLKIMTQKAAEYANFKILRSYVNSIFDWAEELEYIEQNKLEKSLKRINATKKNQLQKAKKEEDLYLSFEQLQKWLTTFQNDYESRQLTLQDYVLFLTIFFLSDRKSEPYAIKWKNVNFTTSQIMIGKTLDKFGNEKSTKGNKTTIFHVPNELSNYFNSGKSSKKKNSYSLPSLMIKGISIKGFIQII